jgi:Tfp pilus assembly protein PilF
VFRRVSTSTSAEAAMRSFYACQPANLSIGKTNRFLRMKSAGLLFAAAVVTLLLAITLSAQGGDHMLFGDLNVDESKVAGLKPLTFDVILYTEAGILVARQPTPSNGRYRFNNLPTGVYQVAIEVEGTEVARVSVDLRSPVLKDVRRDISLEWRLSNSSSKPGVISAADKYVRRPANQRLFKRARSAVEKKRYAKAAELLQQIIKSDAKDSQAWVELANVHFLQKNFADAENEYLHALDARPGYLLALLNLGRLELFQKRYDVAIEALTKAVEAQSDSPDANYFLGEAYLQMKKGSKAVGYLNEAARLGRPEAHLRLAVLYDAAKLKDRAADEYKQFLKKRPDYPDRKKLEKYIAENGKN